MAVKRITIEREGGKPPLVVDVMGRAGVYDYSLTVDGKKHVDTTTQMQPRTDIGEAAILLLDLDNEVEALRAPKAGAA